MPRARARRVLCKDGPKKNQRLAEALKTLEILGISVRDAAGPAPETLWFSKSLQKPWKNKRFRRVPKKDGGRSRDGAQRVAMGSRWDPVGKHWKSMHLLETRPGRNAVAWTAPIGRRQKPYGLWQTIGIHWKYLRFWDLGTSAKKKRRASM